MWCCHDRKLLPRAGTDRRADRVLKYLERRAVSDPTGALNPWLTSSSASFFIYTAVGVADAVRRAVRPASGVPGSDDGRKVRFGTAASATCIPCALVFFCTYILYSAVSDSCRATSGRVTSVGRGCIMPLRNVKLYSSRDSATPNVATTRTRCHKPHAHVSRARSSQLPVRKRPKDKKCAA